MFVVDPQRANLSRTPVLVGVLEPGHEPDGDARADEVDPSTIAQNCGHRLHGIRSPHRSSNTPTNGTSASSSPPASARYAIQLDRYGISAALGPNPYYDTPGEALEAVHAAEG